MTLFTDCSTVLEHITALNGPNRDAYISESLLRLNVTPLSHRLKVRLLLAALEPPSSSSSSPPPTSAHPISRRTDFTEALLSSTQYGIKEVLAVCRALNAEEALSAANEERVALLNAEVARTKTAVTHFWCVKRHQRVMQMEYCDETTMDDMSDMPEDDGDHDTPMQVDVRINSDVTALRPRYEAIVNATQRIKKLEKMLEPGLTASLGITAVNLFKKWAAAQPASSLRNAFLSGSQASSSVPLLLSWRAFFSLVPIDPRLLTYPELCRCASDPLRAYPTEITELLALTATTLVTPEGHVVLARCTPTIEFLKRFGEMDGATKGVIAGYCSVAEVLVWYEDLRCAEVDAVLVAKLACGGDDCVAMVATVGYATLLSCVSIMRKAASIAYDPLLRVVQSIRPPARQISQALIGYLPEGEDWALLAEALRLNTNTAGTLEAACKDRTHLDRIILLEDTLEDSVEGLASILAEYRRHVNPNVLLVVVSKVRKLDYGDVPLKDQMYGRVCDELARHGVNGVVQTRMAEGGSGGVDKVLGEIAVAGPCFASCVSALSAMVDAARQNRGGVPFSLSELASFARSIRREDFVRTVRRHLKYYGIKPAGFFTELKHQRKSLRETRKRSREQAFENARLERREKKRAKKNDEVSREVEGREARRPVFLF